jgi:hypothetical protein
MKRLFCYLPYAKRLEEWENKDAGFSAEVLYLHVETGFC